MWLPAGTDVPVALDGWADFAPPAPEATLSAAPGRAFSAPGAAALSALEAKPPPAAPQPVTARAAARTIPAKTGPVRAERRVCMWAYPRGWRLLTLPSTPGPGATFAGSDPDAVTVWDSAQGTAVPDDGSGSRRACRRGRRRWSHARTGQSYGYGTGRRRRGRHRGAAAHRLLDRGARVTVLEASDRCWRQAPARRDRGRTGRPRRRVDARPPPGSGRARPRGGPRRPSPAARHRDRLPVDARRAAPHAQGDVMGVPGTAAALSGVLSDEGLARIERDAELPTEVGDDVAVGRRGGTPRPRGRRPPGRAPPGRRLRGRRVPHLDAAGRPPSRSPPSAPMSP